MAGWLILRGNVGIDMHRKRGKDNIKIKAEMFKPRDNKDCQQMTTNRSERGRGQIFTDKCQKNPTSLNHTRLFL